MCVVFLSGCAMAPKQPVSMTALPNDCANRDAIVRWLDAVANTPKHLLETQSDYETSRSEAKHRMWLVRYNCQRI